MLEQEMKGKLEQAVNDGNQKAEEYLNIEKQTDDYHAALVGLNKAHFDDNKEIVVHEDEMSPAQIEEFWNYNNVWLKTQNDMMREFPPDVKDASKEEIASGLNQISDKTNEYIKVVDEKIDIAKEKPEQSFGLGKLVFSSIGKINTGFKNIRKSLSKEELFSETGKLTTIFNKAVDAFNKHTRDANDKDKSLTNGIKKLEEQVQNLKKDIDKKLPESKKQIENSIKELEIKKKAALADQASGALNEEEYYKKISELDGSIKNLKTNLELKAAVEQKAKEVLEDLNSQIKDLKECREEVRKDRWRPAAIIASAYDTLVESLPHITDSITKTTNLKDSVREDTKSKNNFAEVKKEVKKLKEGIFNKLNSKIGFIGKAITDKFADSAQNMSNVWEKVGRKLADLSKDEIKQKEYLIKDILDKDRAEELVVRNRDLSGVDFSGKNLNKVSFYDCNLTGAKFMDSHLNEISFFNTKVEHSNFDNAVINKIATHNAYFRGSNFNNAEITGGEFDDKSKKSLLKRAFFTNSSMKNLTCKGVDMFMTYLNSVDLSGAKFNDNNLYDVNFSGSCMPEIINNTNFTKCNLANTGETYKENDKDISLNEWIENDYDREMYEELDKKINNYLDNGDFTNAYITAIDEAAYNDKIFTDMVIERLGTDTNTLQSTINAMIDCKEETPKYGAKLLNDIITSDTYKKARFKNESKSQEVVLS